MQIRGGDGLKYNRILCFVLVISMLSLTGCMDMKDMSEEQTDLIAEYSAGVLLRYSDKYERRLITKEQTAKQVSPQPTATAMATATASMSTTASATANTVTDASPQPTEPTSVDLNALFALDGVSITYDSYQFTNHYGTSQIRAEDGESLLVVTFIVKNTTNKKKKIDLSKRNSGSDGIQYQLDVDGSQYEPGLSILENGGLNFLSTTLAAGKQEEAVLIYRMSEDKKKASSIHLTIKEGDKQSNIPLKL